MLEAPTTLTPRSSVMAGMPWATRNAAGVAVRRLTADAGRRTPRGRSANERIGEGPLEGVPAAGTWPTRRARRARCGDAAVVGCPGRLRADPERAEHPERPNAQRQPKPSISTWQSGTTRKIPSPTPEPAMPRPGPAAPSTDAGHHHRRVQPAVATPTGEQAEGQVEVPGARDEAVAQERPSTAPPDEDHRAARSDRRARPGPARRRR